MPIIDLTHNADGSVRVQRSVTMKVAIGRPPKEGQNYPERLDHFIFQRKGSKKVEKMLDGANGPVKSGRFANTVVWEEDVAMRDFYGEHPKEFWVVFIDDDPDVVFKTEMAMWTKTQCVCRGDGEQADRLFQITKDGKPTGDSERRPHTPCANHGCRELEMDLCKPHGSLYFILADFPAVGSICKLQTTSYQSIREIRSALEDLRSITGGRLMGVKAKITVRLENSTYKDKSGKKVTGTKSILGIELTAQDIKQLTDGLASGLMFDNVIKRLGARTVEAVEDPDEERAGETAAEFYPEEPNDEQLREIEARSAQARETAKAQTITQVLTPNVAVAGPTPGTTAIYMAPAEDSLEPGDITDDDLPREMFEESEEDRLPIGSGQKAQLFYSAWSKRKRHPDAVRKYLLEVHQVERSFDILQGRFIEALTWATQPLPDEPAEPVSEMEAKCRQAFVSLGMDLLQQMHIITINSKGEVTDWNAIWADCNAAAGE